MTTIYLITETHDIQWQPQNLQTNHICVNALSNIFTYFFIDAFKAVLNYKIDSLKCRFFLF